MGLQVLLYWPNIVGYIRIGLVFAAWAAYETPAAFIPVYSLCISLDGVDGWLARRLGQTSRFGAWLDVAVDNLGRGMLWSLLFEKLKGRKTPNTSTGNRKFSCSAPSHQAEGHTQGFWKKPWGWLVSALEWCVFVCNHNTRGEQWKNSFSSSPRLIQAIMANWFRTPLGVWVVSGLHCLPVWLYACRWGVLSHRLELPLWIQDVGILLLAAGRLLALSAEVWCIWTHIEHLCSDETGEKKS